MGLGPGNMTHMVAAGGPGVPAGGGRAVMTLPMAAMGGRGGGGGMMGGPPAMMGSGQMVMMQPGELTGAVARLPRLVQQLPSVSVLVWSMS